MVLRRTLWSDGEIIVAKGPQNISSKEALDCVHRDTVPLANLTLCYSSEAPTASAYLKHVIAGLERGEVEGDRAVWAMEGVGVVVSGLMILHTQAITDVLDGAGRRERERFGGYQVCCDLSCRRG